MNIKFDPIVSEFDNLDQEESYNKWLKVKIEASIADERPTVPHDHVVAHMKKLRENRLKNAGR